MIDKYKNLAEEYSKKRQIEMERTDAEKRKLKEAITNPGPPGFVIMKKEDRRIVKTRCF